MHVEQFAAYLKWVCMVTVVLFLSWFNRKDTEDSYREQRINAFRCQIVILIEFISSHLPASRITLTCSRTTV